MECYLKYGSRFVKRTRNRNLNTIDAILGTKAMAKIYASERDAKKAKTTQEYQFKEMEGKMVIVPVKKVKSENNVDPGTTENTED